MNETDFYPLEILQKNPFSIWLTGLSGSGKSTLSNLISKHFEKIGCIVKILDGDQLRSGINNNLGYSLSDRKENIRRAAEISKLFNQHGVTTINAFICPTNDFRHLAREILGESHYVEIFLDVPLEVCEQRDPKGFYARCRRGEVKDFTGVSSPFEIPDNPHFILKNHKELPEESAKRTFDWILGYICTFKKDN